MDPAQLDRLERLARLRADGTLTQTEFDRAKAGLLEDGSPASARPSLPLASDDQPAADPTMPLAADAELSPTWRLRFAFMDAHGLPKARSWRIAYRKVPFRTKFRVGISLLGYLLGFFYFLYLGLWRPALSLLAISILFAVVLDALKLPSTYDHLAVTVPAVLCGMTVIPLYYLKVRHGIHSWNPFLGTFA